MKVLHIINSLETGGAEKLILDSSLLYEKKDIKIDVLTLSDNDTFFRESLKEKIKGGVFGLTSKSIYNPILVFRLMSFFPKYDIIHIHLFPALYWTVLAHVLSFSKTKLVYTEHNSWNRRRKKGLFKYLDKLIYRRLDIVGCISQGVYDNLVAHIGKNDKIKIIHNGISLDSFNSSEERDLSFFEKEGKVLIQVSSFSYRKDQLTFIESMSLLPENFNAIFVGDGPLRSHCENRVKELGLTDRIKFLGIRNDIPALLRMADAVILSSHIEGFGLAIVEGMASKKPVIATDIVGVKEIVEGHGLLFKQGDSVGLANQILFLFQNDDVYSSIQNSCFLRAKDFDINLMVEKYISEYKSIA